MKQPLINFLNNIRWKNVVLYLLLQILLYFSLFKQDFQITDPWLFLVLSVLFFGLFGNIQNSIVDYELDSLKFNFVPFNKTVYLIWEIIFLILGLLFGFISLSFDFSSTQLYIIFSFPLLLSVYNYFLKKWPLLGNMLIAFLTVLGIMIPFVYAKNFSYEIPVFYFLLKMAFLLTLMRELVKDIEDIPYDKAMDFKTLPVLSLKISLGLLGFLSLLYFYLLFLYKTHLKTFPYVVLLVLGLFMLFFMIVFLRQRKYHYTSLLLKLVMFIGFLVVIFL